MRVKRSTAAALVSTVLVSAALGIPASPASAGPSIGALAGAGERPGATRLSFTVGDSVDAQVDVGTGNLLLMVGGVSLPGANIGAYYNSAAVGSTPASRLGRGWGVLFTPDVRLVENADGSVTYYAAGGLTGVFDRIAGSSTTYTPAAGFKMNLVKNPGTGWTVVNNASQNALRFNTAGELVSITDRNGNATTMTASGTNTHKTITIVTPSGGGLSNDAVVATDNSTGTTTITHGSTSNPLRTVRFEPVDADTMRFVDARGRATSFDFQTSTGRITRVSAPGSVTTEIAYDASGRVISIGQDESSTGGPGDSVTRLAYPSATQTLLAAPDTSQTAAVSAVPHTTYTLDGTQRVTNVVDATGLVRSATYTANFDTATATQGTGGSASTTTNTYGANSGLSLTQTTSAAGSTSQASFAGTGSSQYNRSTSTDDAGNVSTYTYNGSGNQLTSTDAGANQASVTVNPDGTVATATSPGNGSNVTTYGYTNKQATSITPVTGSSLGARAYTYDAMGRLATATNGRGTTRTYSYNNNDQVTQVSFGGTGANGQTSTYGYDSAGRMNSRTDATSGGTTATTTWSYDQLGRLLTRQTTIAAGSGGGGGGQVSYTYDKASNLATSTSTTGETVSYEYDAAGKVTSITYPRPQNGTPGLMKFTYDDQGRRTGTYLQTNATLGNWAARSRNTYDANGRVSRVQADTGPSTSNIVDITYCYTSGTTPAGGCTTSSANDRNKLQWKKDNLNGKSTTYTYDTSGRLTGAAVSGGNTFAYGFDARGNRTSSSSGSTSQSLTFNAANQIATSGYTFDGAGNQTADPSSSSSAITYTGADQLKSVTKSGTNYTYLHGGVSNVELLRQTTPTGTYTTTYGRTASTGVPIVEQTSWFNGTDTFDTSVISDPVTGTPLMLRTDSGMQSMYVFDGTPGAPIALVSSASSQAFGYDYDPFGVPTVTQDSGGQGLPQNPYTFGGTGVKDRTTGWVHYANRYYNTRTGTWTQQDDLDAPLDPANGNRYAFAGSDPINNIDPTGLLIPRCAIAAIAVGSGTALVAGLAGALATGGPGGPVLATTIGPAVAGFVQGACSSQAAGGSASANVWAGAQEAALAVTAGGATAGSVKLAVRIAASVNSHIN